MNKQEILDYLRPVYKESAIYLSNNGFIRQDEYTDSPFVSIDSIVSRYDEKLQWEFNVRRSLHLTDYLLQAALYGYESTELNVITDNILAGADIYHTPVSNIGNFMPNVFPASEGLYSCVAEIMKPYYKSAITGYKGKMRPSQSMFRGNYSLSFSLCHSLKCGSGLICVENLSNNLSAFIRTAYAAKNLKLSSPVHYLMLVNCVEDAKSFLSLIQDSDTLGTILNIVEGEQKAFERDCSSLRFYFLNFPYKYLGVEIPFSCMPSSNNLPYTFNPSDFTPRFYTRAN